MNKNVKDGTKDLSLFDTIELHLKTQYFFVGSCDLLQESEKLKLYISECEVVKWGEQYWILHKQGSFNQNSFKFSIEQKLIIFNQCFLSNCRISIEHINTSNGLYLL